MNQARASGYRLAKTLGVLAITASVPLILSLAVVPHTPLWLQPLFQGAVVLVIGAVILMFANSRAQRRGDSFRAIAARRPIE
jgi:hypothetical protein